MAIDRPPGDIVAGGVDQRYIYGGVEVGDRKKAHNGGVMLSLGIDTTAGYCSVALVANGQTLTADQTKMERGQSEMLLPSIERALAQAGVAFQDLGSVGVTTGPGAFTGIRIGLAAARGLALALGIPCVGVDSFSALARHSQLVKQADDHILAVIDARRRSVFAQLFDAAGMPAGAPYECAPEAVLGTSITSALCVIGSGAALVSLPLTQNVRLMPEIDAPDPIVVARAANQPGEDTAAMPRPFYLRAADARPNPARRKV